MKRIAIASVVVLSAAAAITLPAQTFATLHSFDGNDGALPYGALIQSIGGDLYGTTSIGKPNGDGYDGHGTIFKITPSGTLTSVYHFCSQDFCADGSNPEAGLIQVTNGDLYGTTARDGGPDYSLGTIFSLTPGGTFTTLYSFTGYPTDGNFPAAGLVQATNGDFYGTTEKGGANGGGTVFTITPGGALTILHSFCAVGGFCTDGVSPDAGLIQATNGDLYGTTYEGGLAGGPLGTGGTIFRISTGGALTTLYGFCSQTNCTDGANPSAGLVQATDGTLYGTTYYGGANGQGTVFKIAPSGTPTTLYDFCSQIGCTDGQNPSAALIQATDGNLYGTTCGGSGSQVPCGTGGVGYGTVFKITPNGTLTTLYSFCSQSGCTDGSYPLAGLVQATNGDFYGTTVYGGANDTCIGFAGCGTIFRLSVGLGPFVETRPAWGAAGDTVEILGSDLSGATGVTFNGTSQPTFTVVSRYLITTTVPTGATNGRVEVATPIGTLSSNAAFRVLP